MERWGSWRVNTVVARAARGKRKGRAARPKSKSDSHVRTVHIWYLYATARWRALIHSERCQHSAMQRRPSDSGNWRQQAGSYEKRLLWLPCRGWNLLETSFFRARSTWSAGSRRHIDSDMAVYARQLDKVDLSVPERVIMMA